MVSVSWGYLWIMKLVKHTQNLIVWDPPFFSVLDIPLMKPWHVCLRGLRLSRLRQSNILYSYLSPTLNNCTIYVKRSKFTLTDSEHNQTKKCYKKLWCQQRCVSQKRDVDLLPVHLEKEKRPITLLINNIIRNIWDAKDSSWHHNQAQNLWLKNKKLSKMFIQTCYLAPKIQIINPSPRTIFSKYFGIL